MNSFVPSINPFYTGYRRDKHRSFETFAAHKGTVTVALLAPAVSLQLRAPHAHDGRARDSLLPAAAPTRAAAALLQPESAHRWFSSLTEAEAVEAHAAGEAAMAKRAGYGQIVVTAGYRGEIRVFENFGEPEWI